MKLSLTGLIVPMAVVSFLTVVMAQQPSVRPPKTAIAGDQVEIATSGSGKATLYVVGTGVALRREIQLGANVSFSPDELNNAGHYVVFVAANGANQSAQFDLLPSQKTASLSFLAKPSRLAVNVANGLSGVVYVFDSFGNLIEAPQQASFELSESSGVKQTRTVTTSDGVAWVKMNSASKAGSASLIANVGGIHEKRVVQEVAGEPCGLRMTARHDGKNVALETDPVRDCAGNPVPDGTVVTFTEVSGPREATVDVPLKRGVAKTELPSEPDSVISVAAGVVMGNEIRWSGAQ